MWACFTWGVLREDGRGPEPPESTVEHQLLFGFDRLSVAGVSPHQDMHHRHLWEMIRAEKSITIKVNGQVDYVSNGQLWNQTQRLSDGQNCESYLLFMGQQGHQHQRFAGLHALHHRQRHVNDVQCNIPARLKTRGAAESMKPQI